MSFPLEHARLCLDCDTVFDEPQCPSCGSESYFPMSRWIHPAAEIPRAEPRPVRHTARNTSLLLGGAGLAYGLWKFLTLPEKKPPAPQPARRRRKKPPAGSDSKPPG